MKNDIKLTQSELDWITNSPQGLAALADYHSYQETAAEASADFDDPNCFITPCVRYHEQKRKEYATLALKLLEEYES